jgi:hypothetical protein
MTPSPPAPCSQNRPADYERLRVVSDMRGGRARIVRFGVAGDGVGERLSGQVMIQDGQLGLAGEGPGFPGGRPPAVEQIDDRYRPRLPALRRMASVWVGSVPPLGSGLAAL